MQKHLIDAWRSVYRRYGDLIPGDIEISMQDAYNIKAKTVIESGVAVASICRHRADYIALPFTVAMLEMQDLLEESRTTKE